LLGAAFVRVGKVRFGSPLHHPYRRLLRKAGGSLRSCATPFSLSHKSSNLSGRRRYRFASLAVELGRLLIVLCGSFFGAIVQDAKLVAACASAFVALLLRRVYIGVG